MTIKNQGLILILGLARQRAAGLVLGVIALIAVGLLQLLVPRIIKLAVDELSLGRASASDLLHLSGLVLVLALSMALLRFLWRPLLMGFARAAERDLRVEIFTHLQKMHLAYFDDNPPGEIMARATNDLNNIRMAAGMGLVAALDGLFLGAASIGFMIYISPLLTALALLPMPLIVILTRLMSNRLHKGYMRSQEVFAGMTELVREGMSSIRLVKTYGLEERQINRLDETAQKYRAANMHLARLLGRFFPLMVFITNLSLAVVLGLGGPLTIWGSISPGDFVAFAAYLTLLTWPMMAMGWVVSLIQRAWSSLKRVDQILSSQPAITDIAHPSEIPPAPLGLEVKDLHFAYAKGREVLSGLSFSAPAGKATALVGRIGCGKSTVLSLLGRLFDPPAGAVLVGGVDVLQTARSELRQRVVQVPQEAFLFSTSVRDNLCLGLDGGPSEEKLWQVLQAAGLDKEIRELPQGLDSPLEEGGHNLSGGQRQRLALARALLHEPDILVLDDPLSAVDTQTEKLILANLQSLRAGRTTLLVSHRLASVTSASRIHVLDQGRVVQSGDHQTLMAQEGLYRRLFAEQSLLAELEEG